MDNLKKITYSIINGFLGPNKSNKFLIEDKNVCVTRCPLYILQNHHLKDAASVLMEETLFAHHELYGCSTLSLLAMWYFWDEEFRTAIEEGCEVRDVIKHSQNILELAISALSDIEVSVTKLLVFKKCCPKIVINQNPIGKMNDFKQMPLSIRYTSRHFSPSQNTLNSEDQADKSSEVDEKGLKEIVLSLNHDDDIKINELVIECWKKQVASTNCTKFQIDGIFVCTTALPHYNSTVVDGLVVKSNLNHTWCWDMASGVTNRTLIIMGSITYKYIHLGFTPKVTISVQSCNVPEITKEEEWIKTCCDLIIQLNINVLMVKDEIDPKIVDFCSSYGILVFCHVPLKDFKVLCKALQYSPCSYMWDCNEDSVIKNLTVKPWKPSNHLNSNEHYFLFSILESELPLQTIVICHPSPAILEMWEHQTWHLISRLNLALQNDTLLPGGGETERRCIDFLRKHPQFQKLSDPITRIMTALINGYETYRCVIGNKKDLSAGSTVKIMDEMSSKINAWRSALSLVLLTLQCDTTIINGVEDSVF